MKVLLNHLPMPLNWRYLSGAVFLTTALLVSTAGFAQENMSVEELEEQLEQERVALQEAIANREATAARVEEIKQALAESESQKGEVEEEIAALCEEQESLVPGSLEECLSENAS